MRYFGAEWPVDLERCEPPVGLACARCGEPVAKGDSGAEMPFFDGEEWDNQAWHRECYLRMVVGSLGHQRGTCSCHGGSEEDPAGMSEREAAKEAVAYWEGKQGGRYGA